MATTERLAAVAHRIVRECTRVGVGVALTMCPGDGEPELFTAGRLAV